MLKRRVFIDTNVIIEAFRVGCWATICEHFAVETVNKCVEEALTGNPNTPGRVDIEREELINKLAAQHAVNKKDLAAFVLEYPACQFLDDGERHLLAWLSANNLLSQVMVLLSTADKAAIVAIGNLQGLDSLVSLEHLANESGSPHEQVSALKKHYHSEWLNNIKVKIRLGVIP